MRSDRGGEYTNKELKEFLKDKGIETQYTAAYSPQQNGVAERRNRYLMEMARCILIDAKLPNKYWGKVVVTTNYLQNRLPTSATGRTPYEKWHSRKPNLEHIHVFGSRAYVQIPEQHCRKLDQKAEELLFVGYSEETKGYRLLDKETEKIKISRDVVFLDEHQSNEEEDYRINEGIKKKEREEEKHQESSTEDIGPVFCDMKNNSDEENIKLKRSDRKNKGIPLKRLEFAGRVSKVDFLEPETFEEAKSGHNKEKWKAAMDDEIRSLKQN